MRGHPQLLVVVTTLLWLNGLEAWAQTEGVEGAEAADTEASTTTEEGSGESTDDQGVEGSGHARDTAPLDEVTERVRRHDERAQELFARGDYASALAEQRQAQALLPATPRVFNMALCEERLGNLEAAVQRYRDFLAAEDAPVERQSQARQRIEQLDEQIEAARVAEVAAAAEAARARAAEASQPADSRRDGGVTLSPAVFWASFGVTMACGVTTIVLGALTLVRHDEFLGLYRDDPRSPQLQEQGRDLALATNIMLGVTAFAALTTLVFGLDTEWHRDEERQRTAIVPSAGPGGGGVTLVGRF